MKRFSVASCTVCMKVSQSPPQGPGFGSMSMHRVNSSMARQYNSSMARQYNSTDSERHVHHDESSRFTLFAVYLFFLCSLPGMAAAFLAKRRRRVG